MHVLRPFTKYKVRIPCIIEYLYFLQINKLVRCLTLLKEYAMECDDEYSEERGIPPHLKYVCPRCV